MKDHHAQPPTINPESLRDCVHCGLCLEECPTYKLTGDENNSPRGRLLLWRMESERGLAADRWTDFYTDECVGCLACASACPANVPYGDLLAAARRKQSCEGRAHPNWRIAMAARAVRFPALFNLALAPARLLRKAGMLRHVLAFPGKPSIAQSTANYARQLNQQFNPTGPKVALLTGCLMEALFREINFATIRVLVENNVRVEVPDLQGCCGAFHEHAGLSGTEELRAHNRQVFLNLRVDRVVANSAGCGLALGHALSPVMRVQDVLGFLGEIGLKSRPKRTTAERLFVDLPCHLVHGQRETIPHSVLDATGYPWEFAPNARECCGSGGIYNIQKPGNAREILRGKAAFLDQIPTEISPILATANHVCMMQWHSAHQFVKRPFAVRHVIQLLDPGVGGQGA